MRSAAWVLAALLPMWAAAGFTEKYVLFNSQTCEDQIEDGLSYSRYATYYGAVNCFDFPDHVVAGSVSQSPNTACQAFTSTGCSGQEVQFTCTSKNLFDGNLCCGDTLQGVRSVQCQDTTA